MLLLRRKLMGAEKRIQNLGEEGYRSLGKMLPDPFLDTVWARNLIYLKTPDSFLILARINVGALAGFRN